MLSATPGSRTRPTRSRATRGLRTGFRSAARADPTPPRRSRRGRAQARCSGAHVDAPPYGRWRFCARSRSPNRRNGSVSAVELIAARADLPPGPYLVAGLRRAGLAAARRLVALAEVGAVAARDGGSSDAVRMAALELKRAGVR